MKPGCFSSKIGPKGLGRALPIANCSRLALASTDLGCQAAPRVGGTTARGAPVQRVLRNPIPSPLRVNTISRQWAVRA